MKRKIGKSYYNVSISLDGTHFESCTFENCTLVYSGGIVGLVNCKFAGCDWEFTGAAAATLGFLSALYRMQPMGMRLVEDTFNSIRNGIHRARDAKDPELPLPPPKSVDH